PPPSPTRFPYTTLFRSATTAPRAASKAGTPATRAAPATTVRVREPASARWASASAPSPPRDAGVRTGQNQNRPPSRATSAHRARSEEHTSELQSPYDLV